MSSPDFGRLVNPISTKGGRLCPPNNTGTPGFSNLPTALRQWCCCWNFRWTRGVTWALCHFFITHLGLEDFSVLRLGQPCNLRRHRDWSTYRKGHPELEIWPRFVLRARAQQSQAVVRLWHKQRRGQHRHRLARLGEVIENSWEMYCGQNMDDSELLRPRPCQISAVYNDAFAIWKAGNSDLLHFFKPMKSQY